jgi:alpha-L-fucosidase 2
MPTRLRAIFVFMLLSQIPSPAEQLRAIEYARPGGQPLFLDAAIPSGPGPFPAAILVHGGGWVRGDRHTEMAPLFGPLSGAGIAWFSIDYRLAKDPISFGIAVRDVESAVRFVTEHAAEYNIDPGRIALIGESAGGHLASMAAINPALAIKTVVALYAPTDLASLAENNVGLLPDTVRENLTGTLWGGLILARLSQLSPVDHLRPDMPPFLLIHGTKDPLVPIKQSLDMCTKMKALGNTCEVYPVAGAGHGMRRWQSTAYQEKILSWLDSRL